MQQLLQLGLHNSWQKFNKSKTGKRRQGFQYQEGAKWDISRYFPALNERQQRAHP